MSALRRRAGALDSANAADRYAAGALAAVAAIGDGAVAEASRLAHTAVSDKHWETDVRAGRPSFPALASLAMAGEIQPALAAAGAALELLRMRGSVLGVGLGLGWRAMLQALAEEVGAAETDARGALRVLAETRLRDPAVGVTASLAWALIERGALGEANAVLDATPTSAGWSAAAVSCARARLHLAQHDPHAALMGLAAVERTARDAGWRSSAVLPWRALAVLARLGIGRAQEARILAREELAEAERFGAEREIGRALRLVAHADGGKADDPHLHEAIAALRSAGSELELARALVDHGRRCVARASDLARASRCANAWRLLIGAAPLRSWSGPAWSCAPAARGRDRSSTWAWTLSLPANTVSRRSRQMGSPTPRLPKSCSSPCAQSRCT